MMDRLRRIAATVRHVLELIAMVALAAICVALVAGAILVGC